MKYNIIEHISLKIIDNLKNKMRSYEFHPPEEKNWCVPATLQALLKSRDIKISQTEIARSFPELKNGLDLNEKLLNDFLNEFSLNAEFHNPFTTSYGERFNFRDIELGEVLRNLEEENKDLLAAYNIGSERNHLALVYGFDSNEGVVSLISNKNPTHIKICLSELLNNMNPGSLEVCQNSDNGFYVISKE